MENVRKFLLPSKVEKRLKLFSIFFGIVTIVGLVVDFKNAIPNVLIAANYGIGLSLGATVFIAFLYVSNAGWGIAVRRVAEGISRTFPIALLFFAVVLLSIHSLYEWSHESEVVKDKILQSKSFWLNEKFFIGRTIFYLAIWYFFIRAIVKYSTKQDKTNDIKLTFKNKRLSVLFLVIFALTFSFASFDWLMSLEPHWYSTIFGIYNFSGMFVSGLSAIVVVAIFLKRNGVLENILTESHLHDLGKLMFAFSTFWAYIWFSQYMLIWYSNIPEEVTYFVKRENGSWGIFTIINLFFNWIIPFFILLPISIKRNEGMMMKIAIVLLIGRWIDLFWMVFPRFSPEGPMLNVWVFSTMGFIIAMFFWATFKFISREKIVPINDPMLVESVPHLFEH